MITTLELVLNLRVVWKLNIICFLVLIDIQFENHFIYIFSNQI